MASTKTTPAPSRATRSLFLLALIFAVVAAVLVFVAVNQGGGGGGEEEAAAPSATSSVVVAGKDIPADRIGAEGMSARGSLQAQAGVIEVGVLFRNEYRAGQGVQDQQGQRHQADHGRFMPFETPPRQLAQVEWRSFQVIREQA